MDYFALRVTIAQAKRHIEDQRSAKPFSYDDDDVDDDDDDDDDDDA